MESLERQGLIRSEGVKEAMLRVPRETFVAQGYEDRAYQDIPLHIGEGQTISAPHMVAIMAEALELEPGHRVLEVGAGSGYHACVVACIAREGWVYSIERISSLAERAKENIAEAECCPNITVVVGDGSRGYPEASPYDRIFVTAAAPRVPESLKEQLREGGKILIPVGSREGQDLLRVTKTEKGFSEETLGGCSFVPLVGEEAW